MVVFASHEPSEQVATTEMFLSQGQRMTFELNVALQLPLASIGTDSDAGAPPHEIVTLTSPVTQPLAVPETVIEVGSVAPGGRIPTTEPIVMVQAMGVNSCRSHTTQPASALANMHRQPDSSKRAVGLEASHPYVEHGRLDCDFANPDAPDSVFLGPLFPPEGVAKCRAALEKKADLRFYTTPGSAPVSFLNPLPHARNAQRAIDGLFAECERQQSCRASFPNVRAELDSMIARLKRKPAIGRVFGNKPGVGSCRGQRPHGGGGEVSPEQHPRHRAARPRAVRLLRGCDGAGISRSGESARREYELCPCDAAKGIRLRKGDGYGKRSGRWMMSAPGAPDGCHASSPSTI